MTKIDTVPIHHVELDTESWVPPETVQSWVDSGWVEGPLERLQAERDESNEQHLAAAQAAAAAWAEEHPTDEQLEERRIAAEEAELAAAAAAALEQSRAEPNVATEAGAPADGAPAAIEPPPISGRRRGTSEPAPTGDTTTTPEEG